MERESVAQMKNCGTKAKRSERARRKEKIQIYKLMIVMQKKIRI